VIDLYRFYDATERLLYVGISLSAAGRAADHRGEKGWWRDVARMEVEHLDVARDEALRIERKTILAERPLHNVVHNVTPAPASVGHGSSPLTVGQKWARPDFCERCGEERVPQREDHHQPGWFYYWCRDCRFGWKCWWSREVDDDPDSHRKPWLKKKKEPMAVVNARTTP